MYVVIFLGGITVTCLISCRVLYEVSMFVEYATKTGDDNTGSTYGFPASRFMARRVAVVGRLCFFVNTTVAKLNQTKQGTGGVVISVHFSLSYIRSQRFLPLFCYGPKLAILSQ